MPNSTDEVKCCDACQRDMSASAAQCPACGSGQDCAGRKAEQRRRDEVGRRVDQWIEEWKTSDAVYKAGARRLMRDIAGRNTLRVEDMKS